MTLSFFAWLYFMQWLQSFVCIFINLWFDLSIFCRTLSFCCNLIIFWLTLSFSIQLYLFQFNLIILCSDNFPRNFKSSAKLYHFVWWHNYFPHEFMFSVQLYHFVLWLNHFVQWLTHFLRDFKTFSQTLSFCAVT